MKNAYTAEQIVDMVLDGTCPHRFVGVIDKGRHKGYAEVKVRNVPTWDANFETTLVVPPEIYEKMKMV